MILIISATKGTNYQLGQDLQKMSSKIGFDAQLISLEDYSMPLYIPSEEESNGVPDQAHELAKLFKKANALVFCAPEYNGSIPPIFNNSIAWVSRTDSSDWRSSFNGKFCVVATRSGGGGNKVLSAMKGMLEHLGSVVLPRMILTTTSSPLKEESAVAILTQLKNCIHK